MVRDYDFTAALDIPVEELWGISNQTQFNDVPGLKEIGKMVGEYESRKLSVIKKLRKKYQRSDFKIS